MIFEKEDICGIVKKQENENWGRPGFDGMMLIQFAVEWSLLNYQVNNN